MAYGGGDAEHSSTAAAQGKPVDFHGQMPPLWVSHTGHFVCHSLIFMVCCVLLE